MGRSCSENGRILTDKPKGNRPLRRSRRRLEDYIRMEIGVDTRNMIDSSQERTLMNATLKLPVPKVMELINQISA